MCLRVDPLGYILNASGIHLSMFIELFEGFMLRWPLQGHYEVKLLNNSNRNGDYITYDDGSRAE